MKCSQYSIPAPPLSSITLQKKKMQLKEMHLAVLFAVFANNLLHFIPVGFHLFHKAELGMAALKVVLGMRRFKVNIPLQIIG